MRFLNTVGGPAALRKILPLKYDVRGGPHLVLDRALISRTDK